MTETLERKREEIKAWIGRPTIRSPAGARASVLARIERGQRPQRWVVAALASFGAGALVALAFVLSPQEPVTMPVHVAVSRQTSGPNSPLLVYQLQSGAKLYFELETRSREPEPSTTNRTEGDGS